MKPPTPLDSESWNFSGFVAGLQPQFIDGIVVICRFSPTQTKSVVVKCEDDADLTKAKAIPAGTRVHVTGLATVRSYVRRSTGASMCQMVCLASSITPIL